MEILVWIGVGSLLPFLTEQIVGHFKDLHEDWLSQQVEKALENNKKALQRVSSAKTRTQRSA